MQAEMSAHENTIVQTKVASIHFVLSATSKKICLKPATHSLRRGSPQADMENTPLKKLYKRASFPRI